MKYYKFNVTTQMGGYEWSQKWLVQAKDQKNAQKKADNFNFTHFDNFKDDWTEEVQEVDTVEEIPEKHFRLLIKNKYLYEI